MSNSNENEIRTTNTSLKKKKRSAAAMARRAAKWATQKAQKQSAALTARNERKEEETARQKRVLEKFPNVMGIVGAQGFMPNIKKVERTSKTMQNALKSVPLYGNANRATIYPGGRTLLNKALEEHDFAKAIQLLNEGVPKRVLENPLSTGQLPLQFAYQMNQFPLFQKLLQKGADPNADVVIGTAKLPLLSTIIAYRETTEQKLPYIQELFKHRVNIEKRDSTQRSPLDGAIHLGQVDADNRLAELLIEKGAEVEVPNTAGYTALLTAIVVKNRKILEYIVKKKKVNLDKETGKLGLFPLKVAVTNGSYEILEDLLKYGIKTINQKDHAGNTALHYAVLTKAFRKMKLLKDNGANPKIANAKGVTPFQLAQALDTAGDSRAYDILKE